MKRHNNVQTVVDEQHQLIVEHEVTNDPTDHAHLAEMAMRAKETLAVEQLEVVADMGYYDGAQVKQCAAAGITTYIPKPLTSVNQKRGLFTKQDFIYDEAKDCYRCPAGAELTYRYESFELNRQIRYYTTSKCLGCPLFKKLSPAAIEKMSGLMVKVAFKAGDTVFLQHEPGDALYVVASRSL